MENKSKTFDEIIQGDQPVLVDFYADWCGPCKAMAPILEKVSSAMGGSAKILKVDVDRNPMAAHQFKIRSIPTLLLFHKGEIVWRQTGVVPADQLIGTISTYSAAKAV